MEHQLHPGVATAMAEGARPMMQTLSVAQAWTGRVLRARYQQSVLGWAWAVVQPAATVAIVTLVFTKVMRVDTGGVPYVVFSYTAVLAWTVFANALPDMASSLVNNLSLVTRISFPREALPIAAMAARLADFAVGLSLLAVLMLAHGIPLTMAWLLYLPLVILVQVVLMLGLGLGMAALNVFYRDVEPLARLGLQLWFYASPIIYPIDMVPDRWQAVYLLNPMAGAIQSYRDVLIAGRPPGPYLLPAAFLGMLILAIGHRVFRRLEGRFADVI